MKKLTVTPAWLRSLILVLSGLTTLAAAAALSAYLSSDTLPPPLLFIPLLFGFLLNGGIFIFAFNQEGPLREMLWVSAALTGMSAVLGLLSLAASPDSKAIAEWGQHVVAAMVSVLTFWVANTRVKICDESIAT